MVPRAAVIDREPGCSGVVIDAERGYILTTERALQGALQAAVTFSDGRERISSQIRRDPWTQIRRDPWTQIRRDPWSDLALVIVDPEGLNLTAITWGDPGILEAGDWVIALGQPIDAAPTMSAGIVSAPRRDRAGSRTPLIETDAAMQEVSIGGPLVNLNGEVVGINRMGMGRREGRGNMGGAIPADRARRIAADLSQFGRVRWAYVGVQVEPVDRTATGRLDQPGAVVIAGIQPAGPASEAGLLPGDVILQVGQHPVEGVASLQEAIELAPIGEELAVTVDRQGRRLDLKVRPRELPSPMGAIGPPGLPGFPLGTPPDRLRDREVRPSRPTQPARPGELQPPPPASPPGRPDAPPPQPDPRPEPLPR
jgi:serine protease Do